MKSNCYLTSIFSHLITVHHLSVFNLSKYINEELHFFPILVNLMKLIFEHVYAVVWFLSENDWNHMLKWVKMTVQ